jgi:DNA-binding protein YbaB
MDNSNVSLNQLKSIQDKINAVQQSIQKTITSPNQDLSVTVNGRNQVISLSIQRGTSIDVIEQLLPSMINEAIITVNKETQQKVGTLTNGIMR